MAPSLQPNLLVEEWKKSGSSLSYGGWLERELLAARKDSELIKRQRMEGATAIERIVSGQLSAWMNDDLELWIDAGDKPCMLIELESVSHIEAWEIMQQLIADHYAMNEVRAKR